MASFQYQVTIVFPATSSLRPLTRESRTVQRDGAQDAVAYARSHVQAPDGTDIAIYRRRLTVERINPGDSAAGLRARNPRKVPTGPELVYRRYEVHGGIVRRTDR